MRVLGYLLALLVGFALWGITVALGGGVSPLGKTGPTEGTLFVMPIVAFAVPLAVVAFVRGHALAGSWILAIAPVFGFLNVALAVSTKISETSTFAVRLSEPSTLLLVWFLILGLVLGALEIFGRASSRAATR